MVKSEKELERAVQYRDVKENDREGWKEKDRVSLFYQ